MQADDIFAGDDPVGIVRRWLAEAEAREPCDANAMALASVDGQGMPNVRIVLLKEIEDDGFVFYTNYGSAKGRELDAAGKAAFVLHWKSLGRQVRVRGDVSREAGAAADTYYDSRPLGSRLGAWASEQSRPLASREALLTRVEEARARFGENPPRPSFWGGYRIKPREIELWADGVNRLHDRFRWVRAEGERRWDVTRLNP